MEQGELLEANIIVPHLEMFGMPLTLPENPAQFERISDKRMNGVPVLNVEDFSCCNFSCLTAPTNNAQEEARGIRDHPIVRLKS